MPPTKSFIDNVLYILHFPSSNPFVFQFLLSTARSTHITTDSGTRRFQAPSQVNRLRERAPCPGRMVVRPQRAILPFECCTDRSTKRYLLLT